MRLSVRLQLSLLLILSGCIGLAVLAIATWVVNYRFVLGVTADRLYTSATMRASQTAFDLSLLQTAVTFVTTRKLLQTALKLYINGTDVGRDQWALAENDLAVTVGTVASLAPALVLQTQVFPRNTTGPLGSSSVLNITADLVDPIVFPWTYSNGSNVVLGDPGLGYPPPLYPNLTISETQGVDGNTTYRAIYNGESLGPQSTLVLGPLSVNASFSLISITLPIANDSNSGDLLGWVTTVCDARLVQDTIQDRTGIGSTGQTLLLGPANTTNLFPPNVLGTDHAGQTDVRYLLPLADDYKARHPKHVIGTDNPPFPASRYPAVVAAIQGDNGATQDYGSLPNTHNEANKQVSVGYAMVPSDLVDWVVVVEQAQSEVWQPIDRLRTIILACLFSVMGFLLLVSFPISHWAVLPILRLRAASEQSVDPWHRRTSGNGPSRGLGRDEISSVSGCSGRDDLVDKWVFRRERKVEVTEQIEERDEDRETRFRIPGKVKERKHWVRDEVTDLIKTFNEMADELFVQYTQLEDKVKQRTIELERSTKAAEAANKSKTLFVANVSHELKTPLNGILGMCAVCLDEEDPKKLKTSMGVIYKSGDLLLRTLQDLLTFSQNQVGHQAIALDEKEFVLRDLETQILAIFGQTAKDRNVELRVEFEDIPKDVIDISRSLKDVSLWGDLHRILQVLINLTSNSLKFTPPQGAVTVVVRCLCEATSARGPFALVRSSARSHQKRSSAMSESKGTANFIRPHDIADRAERMAAPAGRDLFMEFEVRDTGVGIAKDMQHRIFEPFVQGDAGLSRKHGGTGLGLSICSQLAILMKGSIGVQSKIGEGSVFTMKLPLRHVAHRAGSPNSRLESVSLSSRRQSIVVVDEDCLADTKTKAALPLIDTARSIAAPSHAGDRSLDSPKARTVRQASKEAKAKKEAQQDLSHIRVLVAEDNKVNQEVILRMLKLEKIEDVTIAEDGQIALDLVKSNASAIAYSDTSEESDTPSPSSPPPFDLILMDVQMPNMDGLQSTRHIRATGYTQPIVALSAFAEQSNIDDCYGSGMNYFLSKPVRRPQLKKVLAEYCSLTPTPATTTETKTMPPSASPEPEGRDDAASPQAETDPSDVRSDASRSESKQC